MPNFVFITSLIQSEMSEWFLVEIKLYFSIA